MNFASLGLAEPLLRAVAAQGYSVPTPIQSQAIPPLLAGSDLLGCAQTGTGKTAAFALPLLHRLSQSEPAHQRRRPTRVLVLAPTRELASQIGESFAAYGRHTGLRHTVVFGGVNQKPQTRALEHGVDILVATPGRLIDLMGQGFVDLRSVEAFVLDEADRMLDMGFMPDVRRVIAKLPARRQTALFSATMPETIERLADTILHQPVRIRIAPVKATTDLIEQSVFFVARQQKIHLLTRLLTTRAIGRALVFTRTKHGADRVSRQLNRSGVRADAIHGNKSQSARERTLADFKSFRTPVLVATDIAARGIDVEGISHVLNYDLPHEAETYVHRIGRTGRAGASGIAVSFCDNEERAYLKAIERLIRKTLTVEKNSAVGSPSPSAAEFETRLEDSKKPARPRRNRAPGKAKRATLDRAPQGYLGHRPGKKKRRACAASQR